MTDTTATQSNTNSGDHHDALADTRPPLGSDSGLSDHVRTVKANGIEIAYETFGNKTDPAILLVMGLGTQMLAWRDEMCEAMADAGHYVIRYDNRDVGLSTHIDAPVPRLTDMANDGIGLLDALGIEQFHLVGASMGGMIAQTMAIVHPSRILTLTLIMTSTGSRRVGRPTTSVMRRLAASTEPSDRDAAIEATVETYRVVGSPAHLDEDHIRDLAGRAFDRAHNPAGRQRQLAAIMAQPDRTAALRKLKIPTLVIHGLDDPLVTPSGGLALAKAIPGATFIGHAGMGHDISHTMWRTVTDDILRLMARPS